ncbi:PAS domain-containing protein [Eubacterium barkeri]|uniref:Stage 0 sporulation protein A homolog n=1 Tax=Eubacterium barkeri TaxID=1528 RepID=A0A1H3AMM3_EUBBA|nr:PAS domain-containing protein [Eubacterium barkeri]SDX30638.1 PAS domain S-box-containing protein [Eubacterium barkeri]
MTEQWNDTITDLRQDAEKSTHLLQTIVDNIPGGVVKLKLCDDKIIPVYMSDGWSQMMGDTKENLMALYSADAMAGLHPDDFDRVILEVAAAMESRKPVNSTYRIKNSKNEYRWVNNRSSVVPEEDGTIYYYAVYTDVTDEITTQQEYEKATKEMELIYNGIPGAVFKCRFDADWTVIFANDGLFRFLGYTRQEFKELFDNKMSGVIYPEDGAVMVEKITKQLKYTTSVVNENRLICKDGSIKWISIHAELMEDENKEQYFYCTFVDVTEQKKAEEELSNTQKKLSAAIDHAGVAYWEYDIRNNRAYLNSVSTSEYKLEEILENYPQSVYDSGTIHPDSVADYQRLIDAVNAGEEDATADIKTIDVNDELVWKRVRFTTLFDENKKPFWAVATAESIDEYKRLEQQFSLAAAQTGMEVWVYDFANRTITRTATTGVDYGVANVIENAPECLVELGAVHPDDTELLFDMYKKLQAGEREVSCELRMFRADLNAYSYHKINYSVIFDKNGKAERAIGTAFDISDYILLKKKYKDSVEYYHNGIDERLLITGHCNITQNFIMEIVSSSGKDYVAEMGDDREAFFTQFSALVVGEEKQREFLSKFLNAPLMEAHKNGAAGQKMECLISMENGNHRYASITIDVMKEPNTGELTGFFAVADITAETIYKKAINSIVDNYYEFIVDVDVKADTYTMLSKRKGLTNIPPSKGVFSKANRENASRFADAESTSMCLKKLSIPYMLERLKEENTYSFNFRMRENDVIRTKKIQVFPIDLKIHHIGFTQVDITELLDIEQQKNEALTHALVSAERANKAKSDFLSRMSHDIRTPMNAILGTTELAMQELDDKAKVLESLSVINSSGKLLLSMINDLLDMSRIESGSLTLVRETFDGNLEYQNMIEMSKVMFEQKRQCFSSSKKFSHQYFMGDIIRLKRVVFNLLNNASKFTPNGGSVKLCAEEQKTANPKIAMLIFEISDSGIGIPQDKLDAIFEPFTQLDTEAKYQGTGLGLSIVKSIVETKGGTITVKSEVGKGTVFTVAFPMEIAQKEAKASCSNQVATDFVSESADFSQLNILLVEDHPVNTMVAKRMLEKHGAMVDTAENGEIAYEKFTKSKINQYNLIFMDIQMPVMNGYESAKAIRSSAHPQAKTIPIIAMTANAYAEDIKNATDSGMNGHIAKPISMELIVQAIHSVSEDFSDTKENRYDNQ